MIVFGLGNPGQPYARTRHNVGFMVVDLLALRFHVEFRRFSDYDKARKRGGGMNLSLVKPTVYMNNSGEVVGRISRRSEDGFVVVCDDTSLPLGKLRIRPRGSDGGHNGLYSVIHHLGTQDFSRLRIGVGPLPVGMTMTDFVLAPFPAEELPVVKEAVARAADAVQIICRQGVAAAMNKFNG